MEPFTEINDTTFEEVLSSTSEGMILFHKKLCPHCKNMEKVLDKFASKQPDVKLMRIDSEDCPEAMAHLNVERVPNLVIIKSGNVVYSKAGLMNPRELLALYKKL